MINLTAYARRAIFIPVCAACGVLVAYTLMPHYIQWDLIRDVGLKRHGEVLHGADVPECAKMLAITGAVLLAPLMVFVPKNPWLGPIAYFGVGGWGAIVFFAVLTWHRGILSSLAWLSLPLLHWLLSLALLRLLQRTRLLD